MLHEVLCMRKNINFKVAQYCKAELEQYCGVTVYMTRTGDTNPSLQERAQIAANYGANILVSIHQATPGFPQHMVQKYTIQIAIINQR